MLQLKERLLKLKWLSLAILVCIVSVQNSYGSACRPIPKGFKVLIWPFGTNVQDDYHLYRMIGLGGFQIDKGHGKHRQVDISVEKNFPFYAGHVADKGYLHLKKNNRALLTGKNEVLKRPLAFSDPSVISAMKEEVRKNISALKGGSVIAYALDDEPSLASFINPSDVDGSHFSVVRFQNWLEQQYNTISTLNSQWGADFLSFKHIQPVGFEQIRKGLSEKTLAGWNLSAWMDFREFMDIQFADVLKDLVSYANAIDPCRPAGIVGGQAPSAWGGYDYGRLSRSVQWMEAYDIHATNEILGSFWRYPKKIRMQTFFSTKDWKRDSWFLWYYMLHGNQAAIAWPEGWFETIDGVKQPREHIRALKPAFEEVQGKAGAIISDQNALFSPDPIGIYYSHPSIRANWAMDALVHGRTWPNRLSSIENENQSAGVLRKAWCKTMEDLGFQYEFINYLDVKESKIDLEERFRVIILPKTICLSVKEGEALRRFVRNGGVLVADHLCGVFDERGRWRGKGLLDDMFGIHRADRAGYLNGKGITEIDGEKYTLPFHRRFTYYKGAFKHDGIVVFERGTRAEGTEGLIKQPLPGRMIEKQTGKGRTYYLNLSPAQYWHSDVRVSDTGRSWRALVGDILASAGLAPRVRVSTQGRFSMLESLFWVNGEYTYIGIVKNPSDDFEPVREKMEKITLSFDTPVVLKNIKTGKLFKGKKSYRDSFSPWSANLYQLN